MHRCSSSLVWGLGLFWELTLTKSFRAFSLLSASPWTGGQESGVSRPGGAGREPRAGPGDLKGAWLTLPRAGAQPGVRALGPGPHLLHQHLHVVGAAPAVGFHDEAKAQGHRRHVHLGAGGRRKRLSLTWQGHTAPPGPNRTPRPAETQGRGRWARGPSSSWPPRETQGPGQSSYRRCQKRKWPILRLARARSSRNLASSQSR